MADSTGPWTQKKLNIHQNDTVWHCWVLSQAGGQTAPSRHPTTLEHTDHQEGVQKAESARDADFAFT